MEAEVVKEPKPQRSKKLVFSIPVSNYKSLEIPGTKGKTVQGECFVKVTDLPKVLEHYMKVNPRVPNRNAKGLLSSPVTRGIVDTLIHQPTQMAIKNRGIDLLVDSVQYEDGELIISMGNPAKYGILDGGHTYAAIREAIDMATEDELVNLEKAYVKLHVLQGIDENLIVSIAEGLNTSRQVDDSSLANLQGNFDPIKEVLANSSGNNAIAFHQGDKGSIYITDVLVQMEFFNVLRYNDSKHPYQLYKKPQQAMRYYNEDLEFEPKIFKELVNKLPDILYLADSIRYMLPESAKKVGFEFGRIKLGKLRAGTPNKGTKLPFINKVTQYRVPNGWIYPILSAFRANLRWNDSKGQLEWKSSIQGILDGLMPDLVQVCITEHKVNGLKPEQIGNRESVYSQCYDRVSLFLARKGIFE